MQTTYKLNTKEIDLNFFESFKKLFHNKNVKITVEEISDINDTDLTAFHRFINSKPIKIDPSLDIRALIDEASDPKIDFK